jgi:hypothetical protein
VEQHDDAREVLSAWLNSPTAVDGFLIDLADAGFQIVPDASREVEAADVLDKMANPHPRLWREAKHLFTARNASSTDKARWETALQMMCAATGYEPRYFLDKIAAEL